MSIVQVAIEVFHGHRVAFANKSSFLTKIANIKRKGARRLNVVTDFDFTLTVFHDRKTGQRAASCHKVIEDCGLLDAERYHAKAQALQRKYYAIEVDPSIPLPERTQHMVDWVTQAHALLVDNGLTEQQIASAVQEAVHHRRIAIRDGVNSFFDILNQNQIPTLIFSAGIAEVLEQVIRRHRLKINWSMVSVISNRCIFEREHRRLGHVTPSEEWEGEDGENGRDRGELGLGNSSRGGCVWGGDEAESSRTTGSLRSVDSGTDSDLSQRPNPLVGFVEPVIHVLNKRSSTFMQSSDYFRRPDMQGRDSVLLLGDSMGDIYMSEGFDFDPDCLLKIGFLNDRVEERMAQYLGLEQGQQEQQGQSIGSESGLGYDLVVLGDGGFDVPNGILRYITEAPPSADPFQYEHCPTVLPSTSAAEDSSAKRRPNVE